MKAITMNDKELLEMAAKAVGYTFDSAEPFEIAQETEDGVDWIEWNPLVYDGNALQLSVDLGLCIVQHSDITQGALEVVVAWADDALLTESYGNDPYAATRRAIVRAAAEIGRTI